MFALLLGIGVPVRGEETPSVELLEFLGEWETSQGQWVDPLELDTRQAEGIAPELRGSDEN
jgi:hypothetical protein